MNPVDDLSPGVYLTQNGSFLARLYHLKQGDLPMTTSKFTEEQVGFALRHVFQVWGLSLLAALYLLRGMLEFPSTGWQPQTVLTVLVGLGLLPALAALAAAAPSWRRPVITALCVLGVTINAVLLVALWHGFTPVAAITLLIVVLYGAVAWVAFYRP